MASELHGQQSIVGEQPEREGEAKSVIYVPSASLVEFDPQSDIVRGELVQVIVTWLVRQGLTSSAQLLRDEAASLLRQEHNERKAFRAISRAIQEGNWDAAHGQVKKLESITKGTMSIKRDKSLQAIFVLRSMPFLLAQEQFLEYVDEDDGQRAHSFFMRKIKPLEGMISRDHFQQLIYLLTCRAVSEAGTKFPVWRGWTPMLGRAQLQSIIEKFIGYCDSSPYCHQYEHGFDGEPNVAFRGLEEIVANSLSYELLRSQYPSLLKGLKTHPVFSLSRPLGEQLIPSKLLLSVDVNKLIEECSSSNGQRTRLTACQPFLQIPAVAVGTHTGSILWIPLENRGGWKALTSDSMCLELYKHNTPVRGMTTHNDQILLSWSGCQAVILNLSRFMGNASDVLSTSECLVDCVANTFTHTADVYSACLFPCGLVLATGLSEGTVTLWDLITGAKMCQHGFNSFAIESLVANRSGNCYFAASKEGIVRVVHVATGSLLFSFASPVASEVSSMAISPSASLLLVSYRNGALRLWDVLTENVLSQRFLGFETNTRRCASVSFGCIDSHIISGSDDGCLYLWDTGYRRPRQQSSTPVKPETAAEGNILESYQIDASTGMQFPILPGRHYWEVGDAVPPSVQIRLHRSQITDVKFQHNFVVTCGDDGVVCICGNILEGAFRDVESKMTTPETKCTHGMSQGEKDS